MINYNYKPSFCGIPVLKANILKKDGTNIQKVVPVVIEKISASDTNDLALVLKIAEKWGYFQKLAIEFATSFACEPEKTMHFLIKTLNKECVGILETTNPTTSLGRRVFKIDYVVAKPHLLEETKYKGIGFTALYNAIKTAKDAGYEKIRLFSSDTAVNFYKKLGFKLKENNSSLASVKCFELPKKDFDAVLKNYEKKYGKPTLP